MLDEIGRLVRPELFVQLGPLLLGEHDVLEFAVADLDLSGRVIV